MIDRRLLRDEKTRKIIYDSEKNRFKDPEIVTKCSELDQELIKLMFEKENISKKMNKISKDIREIYKKDIKKNNIKNLKDLQLETKELKNINDIKNLELSDDKKNLKNLQLETKELKNKKEEIELKISAINYEFNKLFKNIGNILDSRVPISKNENEAPIISEYISNRNLTPILDFSDIMEKLGCIDMKRGSKVAGHRGYFLLEHLALLENALVRYAIDFMRKFDYKLIQAPVLVNKEIMKRTCQLSDFDEQLYETNEFFLCATSEQPISGLYMDERLTDEDLPKKFVGQSLCFRKEAGAAGKDNKGIFRVHQFEKIEQFVICKPEDSDEMHKEMIKLSEEFYKSLNISYRVITIVSGDMNDAASLKYDLEAFFPSSNRYRELVSASNCTDYQSRDLEIRYGLSKIKDEKKYCHLLNATLCAVQRTLCCLVENYQTEKGVIIPEVLRSYMDNIDFISYTK